MIYVVENVTIVVKDFPSYRLRLYETENQTDPHRAINSFGMARVYAQIGRMKEANQIYEKLLHDCSDSNFLSDIDQLVIRKATDYVLRVQINQTGSNA